jgi:polyhydroxyalkanoate synthase
MANPMNTGGTFMEMTTRPMAGPSKRVTAQMALWMDYLGL